MKPLKAMMSASKTGKGIVKCSFTLRITLENKKGRLRDLFQMT